MSTPALSKRTKLTIQSPLQPLVLVKQLGSSPEGTPKHKRPVEQTRKKPTLGAQEKEWQSKSAGNLSGSGRALEKSSSSPTLKQDPAARLAPKMSTRSSPKSSPTKMPAAKDKPGKDKDQPSAAAKKAIASIVAPKTTPLRINTANSRPKLARNPDSPSSLNSPAFITSVPMANATKSSGDSPITPTGKRMIMPSNTNENTDIFSFIKHLPLLSPKHKAKSFLLPKKTRSAPKLTLVLDLDETLVHCDANAMEAPQITFPVVFNGHEHVISGNLRPHCLEFLQKCAHKYEVVLFTASQKIYADQLATIIDPTHSWFKYRLFRESCTLVGGNYVKDLDNLGRDLTRTVIVDNSPQAFGYHINNGIPIKSWYQDHHDEELLRVYEFLEELEDVDDVRYAMWLMV
ncbi:CTD small phosphatase-like protein 2 [Kappamyces sp. JEL0829]|nr:CTD small phosphatase-like protein 2 [Kappamyces sp. JEL0829]